MSKSSVFFILSAILFSSVAALIFISYPWGVEQANGASSKTISENQLIAGLAAATIGSLLTAFVVFVLEDHRDKRRSSVELLEEFTSYDFLETRNRAGLVLKEHLHFPLKGLDDLYFVLRNDDWRYVSHIEHFFKKVDRLLYLGELDKKYVKSFLGVEFPHWYNRYFFPARLADIARRFESDARVGGLKTAHLLPLSRVVEGKLDFGGKILSIPLPKVDYVEAHGAERSSIERSNSRREVLDMIEHVESLLEKGVVESKGFHRTKEWGSPHGDQNPKYHEIYDGSELPFPELRALTR